MSGYNKFRGTLIHALMEADPDPPPYVIQERRVARWVDVQGQRVRVTGKPDYVDPVAKMLIDYKSKHNLPLKLDEMHEAQFNIYRWLLADGTFLKTKDRPEEPCQIEIERIGAHYVTFNTKPDKAWKKVLYPVWELEYTEQVVVTRLEPLIDWRETGVLPKHIPYVNNRFWTCDCERYEQQLAERGIELR